MSRRRLLKLLFRNRMLDFPKPTLVCVSIWQAPPEPVVKFNFDSAFNAHSRNVADAFATEAYAFVHDIKVLSRDFRSISFSFALREANNAAHVLARECRSYPAPCYWIEEAPEAIIRASKLDQRRLPHP
ncbi:hypothetical protein V6N13_047029 [Hibiscus sabdariffa]